ncbi:Lethal(2) giant larvae sro7 [Dispira simplex]|nr:Lethal(2) giant larvae sro7 [Dispira simplex]
MTQLSNQRYSIEHQVRKRLVQNEAYSFSKGIDHADLYRLERLDRFGMADHATALAYHPVQRLLAIGTANGQVVVLGKPGVKHYFDNVSLAPLHHLWFHPNSNRYLLVVDARGELFVLDLHLCCMKYVYNLRTKVVALDCLPGNNWCMIAFEDGSVDFIDPVEGAHSELHIECLLPVRKLHAARKRWGIYAQGINLERVVGAALNPADSDQLLMGFTCNFIVLWSISQRKVLFQSDFEPSFLTPVHSPTDAVPEGKLEPSSDSTPPRMTALAWQPDGAQWVTVYTPNIVAFWSAKEFKNHPLSVRPLVQSDVKYDGGLLGPSSSSGAMCAEKELGYCSQLYWCTLPSNEPVESAHESNAKVTSEYHTALVGLCGPTRDQQRFIHIERFTAERGMQWPTQGTVYPMEGTVQDLQLLPTESPWCGGQLSPAGFAVLFTTGRLALFDATVCFQLPLSYEEPSGPPGCLLAYDIPVDPSFLQPPVYEAFYWLQSRAEPTASGHPLFAKTGDPHFCSLVSGGSYTPRHHSLQTILDITQMGLVSLHADNNIRIWGHDAQTLYDVITTSVNVHYHDPQPAPSPQLTVVRYDAHQQLLFCGFDQGFTVVCSLVTSRNQPRPSVASHVGHLPDIPALASSTADANSLMPRGPVSLRKSKNSLTLSTTPRLDQVEAEPNPAVTTQTQSIGNIQTSSSAPFVTSETSTSWSVQVGDWVYIPKNDDVVVTELVRRSTQLESPSSSSDLVVESLDHPRVSGEMGKEVPAVPIHRKESINVQFEPYLEPLVMINHHTVHPSQATTESGRPVTLVQFHQPNLLITGDAAGGVVVTDIERLQVLYSNVLTTTKPAELDSVDLSQYTLSPTVEKPSSTTTLEIQAFKFLRRASTQSQKVSRFNHVTSVDIKHLDCHLSKDPGLISTCWRILMGTSHGEIMHLVLVREGQKYHLHSTSHSTKVKDQAVVFSHILDINDRVMATADIIDTASVPSRSRGRASSDGTERSTTGWDIWAGKRKTQQGDNDDLDSLDVGRTGSVVSAPSYTEAASRTRSLMNRLSLKGSRGSIMSKRDPLFVRARSVLYEGEVPHGVSNKFMRRVFAVIENGFDVMVLPRLIQIRIGGTGSVVAEASLSDDIQYAGLEYVHAAVVSPPAPWWQQVGVTPNNGPTTSQASSPRSSVDQDRHPNQVPMVLVAVTNDCHGQIFTLPSLKWITNVVIPNVHQERIAEVFVHANGLVLLPMGQYEYQLWSLFPLRERLDKLDPSSPPLPDCSLVDLECAVPQLPFFIQPHSTMARWSTWLWRNEQVTTDVTSLVGLLAKNVRWMLLTASYQYASCVSHSEMFVTPDPEPSTVSVRDKGQPLETATARPTGTSGSKDVFAETERILDERQERLASAANQTSRMNRASQGFLESIKAFNERNGDKKWYQL